MRREASSVSRAAFHAVAAAVSIVCCDSGYGSRKYTEDATAEAMRVGWIEGSTCPAVEVGLPGSGCGQRGNMAQRRSASGRLPSIDAGDGDATCVRSVQVNKTILRK